MFEKTLTDVVKGIRASKRDTQTYISQCIAEIKTEINSTDLFVKANALQKLTFLQMMGYSMSWASFATIEVMSSPRFSHKRVGYLAASQGFTQDTEVILLTTNLLKKEMRGAVGGGMHGVYDAGLAINCLSNIVTEDLARDLLPELTSLTSHPQPYLRKKALLCLYKLFIKYPQGLRLTFARLQQSLEDPNSSVVSCAVNVITELSDKAPRQYLHLAPAFFQLLTQSSNNWMLIKVVKLLGSLVAEEPRLARKLLDPLAGIVRSTQAKSLLYESVRTITLCLPYCRKSDGSMPTNVPEIVELCANTLLDYVTQTDQNLKYLGLVGFGSLMQSHPKVLSDPKYRSLILACLSDQDVTIRTRALDLLTGMASRKNLVELVSQLLKHVDLASGTYKHDLVAKIVEMCSGEKYALLQDFAWYLDILFQLGHMRGIEKHGELLRAQITDIALRVLPIRPYAVRRSMEILLEGEGEVSDDPLGDNGRGKHMMLQILPALAWTIGEYSDLIREALAIDPDEDANTEFSYDDDSKGTFHSLVQCLVVPSNTQKLPASSQKVYVQAAMKVFAAASSDSAVEDSELEAIVKTLHRSFPVYTESTDVEVVERSFSAIELMKSLGLSHDLPGLMKLAEDDSSDDGGQGDLLGIEENKTPKQKKHTSTSSKSIASKVRGASATLVYLLKPAPMKPCGAKAQRKKRQTPLGVTIDLDAPVDMSIFESLVAAEEAFQADSKMSMECVSFTQQHPFKVEQPSSMGSHAMPSLGAPALSNNGSSGPLGFSTPSDASTSFQKPNTEGGSSAPRNRQGDPFYLDSAPSVDAEEGANSNRFGAIQLLDSSDEEERAKQKKKKPKKVRKTKGPTNLVGSDPWLGAGAGLADVVYESDDDEGGGIGTRSTNKKRPSREFAGLAKVDLTTPLRDDEVMLERTHRVVPDRPLQEAQMAVAQKKKPKKSKKKSSKKPDSSSGVGDLLDLGGGSGFGEANIPTTSSSFTTTATTPASSNHAINSAFDDLLGDYASPAPQLSGGEIHQFSAPLSVPTAKGKRPWLEATVKASTEPEWSQVSVFYRAYRVNEGSNVGAKIVMRIDNRSDRALDGLSLEFKDRSAVDLGSVNPRNSCESSKVGPFAFSVADASDDIKCVLRSAASSVSVKIFLPASLLLNPENEVSLEQVSQELSSSEWTSASAKVSLGMTKAPEEVKEALSAFLRAAAVDGSTASPAAGTYASRSIQGSPVRFLVKVKDSSVKIDIKSTSASLCKSLASDLKRLEQL